MTHPDLILFIFSLAVLLLTALVFGRFALYLRAPKVIGEFLGGIVLGPAVFGFFSPNIQFWLFNSSAPVLQARDALVKLGAIFLLFVIGLEINLFQIKEFKKTIVWISVFGSILPFALGFFSVIIFPGIWNYSSAENKWLLPLFIGTALSISALPVIARILKDLGILKNKIGSIILGSATLDDITGWILFAVIVANFSFEKIAHVNPAVTAISVILMFIFSITIGRKMAKKLSAWCENKNDRDSLFLGIIIVIVLLASVMAEKIGIHAILGAFLAGIAFSDIESNKIHTSRMVAYFFSPLYFVSVGLQVNFLKHFDLALVLIIVAIAVFGKILGAFIGAKISKLNNREALAIGFGMNARGAVGIILSTAAFQAKLIDERIFTALIVMAMATTLISGPLMKWALADKKIK